MVRRRGIALDGEQALRQQRGIATNATTVLTALRHSLAARMSSTVVNVIIPGATTAGKNKCGWCALLWIGKIDVNKALTDFSIDTS